MSADRKSLDDYEYKVRIHQVDQDGTVWLLFEEVDGNDGFSVQVSSQELRNMLSSGTFDDWAADRVTERVELLKRVRAEEQAREQAREAVKDVEKALEKKRIKRRSRTRPGSTS